MNLLKFIDHIDLSHMPEGSFWADFYHPDDSSVGLIGNIKYHGKLVQTGYDDEPYFDGGAVIAIDEIITYDSTGAIVPHSHEKEFISALNKLVNYGD